MIILREVVSLWGLAHAPHMSELTFYPIDAEYYYIWYRVGGGGGHMLFLKDIEVGTFVFDEAYL